MTEPAWSRRTMLCGVAAAALVSVALAACSPDTDTDTDPALPPESAGTELTAVDDVPIGGGVVVDVFEGPVVVVRPTADELRAFRAVCPHQGTTVLPPEDGVITCPAHGSQFDGVTGELLQGPAITGLIPVPIRVENGQVVLA